MIVKSSSIAIQKVQICCLTINGIFHGKNRYNKLAIEIFQDYNYNIERNIKRSYLIA